MVLALIFALALVSCSSFELNNPDDPRNSKGVVSSSSLEEYSSSSHEESSSSFVESSSSIEEESSPSEELSSSSEEPSSSSEKQSSSSEEFSSSSKEQSSSSDELNSSSSSEDVGSSAESCLAPGNYVNQFCDERDGKVYKYVKIDNQTWMAENLNLDIDGGKCNDEDDDACTTYGKFYDWATAMGFDESCNSGSCANKIESPHQGICPSGWHIPSNVEWDELYLFASPNNMDDMEGDASPYHSLTAGRYLKAKSSWEDYEQFGNGEDTYGFAALAGGFGSSLSFSNIGRNGIWWSAVEYSASNAYNRFMYWAYDRADWKSGYKVLSYNIRCIKDN